MLPDDPSQESLKEDLDYAYAMSAGCGVYEYTEGNPVKWRRILVVHLVGTDVLFGESYQPDDTVIDYRLAVRQKQLKSKRLFEFSRSQWELRVSDGRLRLLQPMSEQAALGLERLGGSSKDPNFYEAVVSAAALIINSFPSGLLSDLPHAQPMWTLNPQNHG